MRAFIIAAMTADGNIAKDPLTPSTTWTGKEDKKRFIELTKRAGVIVMGLNTYNTIGKPLPGRVNIVYAPAGTPPIPGVEMTTKSPAELLSELEARGLKEAAICGGSMIYTMFMKSGLVNKLYLTIEPVAFGDGVRLFKEGFERRLKLENCTTTESGALQLEYSVN